MVLLRLLLSCRLLLRDWLKTLTSKYPVWEACSHPSCRVLCSYPWLSQRLLRHCKARAAVTTQYTQLQGSFQPAVKGALVCAQAVDIAVSEEGWQMVLLLRLAPVVPFAALNYAMGATSVGLWPYTWASALGILPGAARCIPALIC